MTLKRFLIFAAILASCGKDGKTQGTNCSQASPASGITAAGNGTTLNNRVNSSPGCVSLVLTYFSTGFSALSISVQGAPDSAGSAGTFVDISSSFVTQGTNPSTTLQSVVMIAAYYPWLRVKVNSVTGSGTIRYTLNGFNGAIARSSGGGGGGGGLVASVFGRTGAVVAVSGDYNTDLVTEGVTNLYFTAARAHAAFSGVTPISYNSSTGAISCPTCVVSAPVTSVFARTGAVTAQSGDYNTSQVTEVTNLYYTDARARLSLSASSPISYNNSTGAFTCPTCNTSAANVISVFTRTGAVVAGTGDYTAAQVTNAFDLTANNALGAHHQNWVDIATPSNPAASSTETYTKNGQFCSLDSSGNEYCTGLATATRSVLAALPNASSTGTTANKLVKLTGAPSTGVINTTGDVDGVVGVCFSGCGTTGSAVIAIEGLVQCVFENGTTAGNYVVPGTSVNGDCKDAGTSTALPVGTAGNQVIGRVLSTNGGAGTYQMMFWTLSPVTTKFRSGLYLSAGTTGFVPSSNDNIQGIAAGTAIWGFGTTGILIKPQGAGGSTGTGPLDVEGGTVGNALTTQGVNTIIGPSGPQTGNNSSATGGVGGANTFTAGRGGGFTGGSSSVGGVGGASSLIGGQGGDANSGSTNGAGGDAVVQAGAPGAGGGTAGAPGKISLKGQPIFSNVNGTTSIDVGTLATGSNDMAGKITSVTGAYTGVITFSKTWPRAPACFCSNETTAANVCSAKSTTTTVTIVTVSAASDVLSYACMGY